MFKLNKFNLLLTIAVISVILMTGLSSCIHDDIPTEQSKWVIKTIRLNKKGNGTCIYFAFPICNMNLDVSRTFFVDSIGKYNTGDTIHFQLYKKK